jgi:diguanylate cyclase
MMAAPVDPGSRDTFRQRLESIPQAHPAAVALVDLDGFKRLNDQHGRGVGDRVLERMARTLTGSLPDDAFVARLGGDEFGILLPGRSAESALILFEEIRAYLATHPLPETGRPATISVGIAARPPHGITFDELMRAADQAMYRAKADGRDRVAIHVDEKMVMKSNYYDRAALARLAKLAENTGRTEASLLREALDDLFRKHAASL